MCRLLGLHLVFLLFFLPSFGWAHKLSLFLSVKGVTVEGFAYFSTGAPARKSPVEVYDCDGKMVWKGRTDERGEFRFFAKGDSRVLKVVVNALDGHRVEESLNLWAPESPVPSPDYGIRVSQVIAGLGWIMGIFGSVMFWLSGRNGS